MRNIFIIWLFCFTCPLFGLWITLSNGTVLYGEIVEHNDNKLVLQRLDTFGIVEIPWTALHPIQRQQLQQKLGLILAKTEVSQTIPGIVLYLRTGSSIMGEEVERKGIYVVVRNKTGIFSIELQHILKEEAREIPVTDIYRMSEVYGEMSKRYKLEKADGHWQFGQWLMQIEDFEHAQIHLQRAKTLDTSLSSNVNVLLDRIQKRTQEIQQKKLMQKFQLYRNSKHYDQALAALDQLKSVLEPSQWQQYREETLSQQSEYLRQTISQEWVQQAQQKIGALALNRKLTLQQAQQFILQKLDALILAELAKIFGMEQAKIQEYWEKREKSAKYRFSYGDGTFIVGLQGQEPEENAGSVEWEPPNISKQLLRQSTLSNSEEWWQAASSSMRKEWLLAYYSENRLTVAQQELKTCPSCSGRGTQISSSKIIVCPACHGLRAERVVISK